jgi:hypothetical protein
MLNSDEISTSAILVFLNAFFDTACLGTLRACHHHSGYVTGGPNGNHMLLAS